MNAPIEGRAGGGKEAAMAGKACIVCGTDLSERARPALEVAAALNAMSGAELALVHVADRATRGRSAADGGAAERLAAWRGGLGARLSLPRIRDVVLAGPVAKSLASYAEERDAALVVVSSTGHRKGSVVRMAGTSERIAVESRRPVLVVRDSAPFTRWARGERPLRIVLAVDFTPTSEPAIRVVRFLRAAGPTEVVVTHVHYPDSGAADEAGDAHLALDLARRVGDLGGHGPVAYRPFAGIGRTGDHVLEAAAEERADVIVVGTRARRGYRRLASVSSVVLHHGRTSVVCAPRTAGQDLAEPMSPFRRVMVPVDLSDLANAAVACAYRLVQEGGEVWLLHVAKASPREGRSDRDRESRRRMRALVPPWSARRGIVTRTEVAHARDVARAICEAAARRCVDVVCTASHGRTGLTLALRGSVSKGVVRRSDRPVVVVPPQGA